MSATMFQIQKVSPQIDHLSGRRFRGKKRETLHYFPMKKARLFTIFQYVDGAIGVD